MGRDEERSWRLASLEFVSNALCWSSNKAEVGFPVILRGRNWSLIFGNES